MRNEDRVCGAQGDRAVYRWTFTGTNTGPEGSGKAVRFGSAGSKNGGWRGRSLHFYPRSHPLIRKANDLLDGLPQQAVDREHRDSVYVGPDVLRQLERRILSENALLLQ
jgi:hypothetical protein